MLNIPFKARSLGAESLNDNPVKYNKTRISGSIKPTYTLHIRGASMPGNKDKFTTTSKSKPKLNEDLFNNKHMKAFQLNNIKSYKYKEFNPNDDDALLIAINALYRQICGNLYLMDFERPIDIERRLRNGDITIKEFTRQACKSNFYRNHYFTNISQYKSIKLRYKHLLGRPIINQREIIESSDIINKLGFEAHIDWIIDSKEYNESFGEDIVPYMKSWNSSKGLKTKSFLDTSSLTQSFAKSDICYL